MRYGPPFRSAIRPGGGRVAYQVVGDGDLDPVFLFGWTTHLGLMWENPSFAAFLGKLPSFSRLILFMAATYPDEVSAVVTFGSHPATLSDDYPSGRDPRGPRGPSGADQGLPGHARAGRAAPRMGGPR